MIFVAIVGDHHQQLPQISLPGGDVHHLVFTVYDSSYNAWSQPQVQYMNSSSTSKGLYKSGAGWATL